MDVQQGDISFSGKRASNWYSDGVKAITESKWSHSFIVAGLALGELSAMEADLDVTMVSWQSQYVDKNNDYYEVWRPIKASQSNIEAAAKYCYNNYAEEPYGFLEIPWFIYRIYAKKWFGINATTNWSSSGMFCSGLTYNYLYQLGGEYRDILKDFKDNTMSPQDLYNIVLARPDLFEFVLQRV